MHPPHDTLSPPAEEGGDRRRAEYLLKRRGPDPQLRDLSDQELRREAQLQRLELELKRQRLQSLQRLLDSTPTGVLLLDPDATIQSANLLAAELLGAPRDKLIGASLYDFIDPHSRPSLDKHRRRLLDEAGSHSTRITIELPTGAAVDLALFSRTSFDHDAPPWHALVFDHRAICAPPDNTTRSSADPLPIRHRMETLGRLANGITHDFNNLLTLILGYAKMILNRLPDDDPSYPLIEQIHRAGDHAGELIGQLLTYSNESNQRATSFDLNDQLTTQRSMLDRLAGDEIQLHFHLQDDLPPVRFQPSRLQQVLLDLIIDARDSIAEKGRFFVRTTISSPDGSSTEEPSFDDAQRLILDIESDGRPGPHHSPPDLDDRPPFLPELLDQPGIHFEFQRPDSGTSRLRLYLPITQSEPPDTPHYPPSPKTVLIVDDRPELRDFAALVLDDLDLSIISTTSGTEALQLARSCGSNLSLLISDVTMPDINGPQLHADICSFLPNTPAIFMSGYDRNTLEQEYGLLECAHFIEKPFDPNDLKALTRSLLDLPD